MTINQLNKLTAKLVAQGLGRRRVCVNKDTFRHPLESDGCCVLDVEVADMQVIELADEDGGTAFDSRGRTKTFTCLVLSGGADDPEDIHCPSRNQGQGD